MTAWLDRFNRAPLADAEAAILGCCGSRRFARDVAAHRPYAADSALIAQSHLSWGSLAREDWLEAFAAHPRIGDVDTLRAKMRSREAREQAGVRSAPEATILALADGNREYERRFGHVFLICASGKSADEMLAQLRARLAHEPDAELAVAAAEQAKITELRLRTLFTTPSEPT